MANLAPVLGTILVIDDEADAAAMIKRILQREGHAVELAFSGREALKFLGVEPLDSSAPLPDMLILDIMMPEMDGITVYRKLKAAAHTKPLPIVVLTARSQNQDSRLLSLSVAAYIPKPFDVKDLRAIVNGVLANVREKRR